MVKSKNCHSTSVHRSKYRTVSYQSPFAKKLILGVIFATMAMVVIAVICTFFLDSERLVKSKIYELATDYYENYYYENLVNSEQYQKTQDIDSALAKYHDRGLAPITLNDLLLYDNQKNSQYRDYLTKYCDETATTIKFYMDPPYDRTSYRTDITYACNF